MTGASKRGRGGLLGVALIAGLFLVLLTTGVATASPFNETAPQPVVGANEMVELGSHLDDRDHVVRAIWAQLAQQGAISAEVTAQRGDVPPPRKIHRQTSTTCDLNGDGHRDLLVNAFDLTVPPYRSHGTSNVRALSGLDGSVLWEQSNHLYFTPRLPGGVSMERSGDPLPRSPDNALSSPDVDGDDVCDPLVFGFEIDALTTPFIAASGYVNITTHVAVLSGANGTPIWERSFESDEVIAQDPFLGSVQTAVVQGMPTGFLHYTTPQGPRFVLKTSDVRYARAQDSLAITSAVLGEPLRVTDMRVSDRVRVLDVATGDRMWQRNLTNAQGAHTTNLTWITGVADLTGDDQPEVVLDQFLMTSPRGTEAREPLTGKPIFRFDRGMRVLALQGAGEGAGQTLWSRLVLEPGAPEPNPGFEENYEHPIWGHTRIVGDLTDDGTPEVLAEYLAREESASVTPVQSLRTHFVPLEGTSGAPLWDTKMGGWGFGQTIDLGNGSAQLVAGTVDFPAGAGGDGRFPPLSTRVTALTPDDGTAVWSHEWPFAEHSYEAYQVALRQYQTDLAPTDVDGDGSPDIVSTAQNVPPQGPNQELLATQIHSYDLVSGQTGDGLAEMQAWGGLGLIMPCGSTEQEVTVLAGHPRRLELTRLDLGNGSVPWQETIWNNPSPRTPSNGIDTTGFQGTCDVLEDGSTFYTVNVDAFSTQRLNEVISIVGKLTPDGERDWQRPRLVNEPAEESRLAAQAAVIKSDDGLPSPTKLGLSAGIGALVGFAAVLGWARWRDAPSGAWLSVSLALILVTTTAPAPVLAGYNNPMPDPGARRALDTSDPEPPSQPPSSEEIATADLPSNETNETVGPSSERHPRVGLIERLIELGPNASANAQLDAYQQYFHEVGYPVPPVKATSSADPRAAFGGNASLGYTETIGDIDGDGVEDTLLDLYCLECYRPLIGLDSPVGSAERIAEGNRCGLAHAAVAMSGKNGSALWTHSLDEPVPPGWVGCAREFVMGTTPLPSGATGILVYRLEIQQPPFTASEHYTHTLYMLDATDGERRWSYTETGYRTGYAEPGFVGDTFLIQPILQTPAGPGEATGARGDEPALFVQGVGAAQTIARAVYPPPGMTSFVVLDSYQPMEWAARIDLGTGEEEWRRDTYAPQRDRSVLPQTLQVQRSWGNGIEQFPSKRDALYWNLPPCCGDLTGDGVPELVYTTDEWSTTPMTNTQGPYRISASLRVLDGATGERLYDVPLAEDVPTDTNPPRSWVGTPFFDVSLKPLGDTDGDGGGELLVQKSDRAWRPNYTLAARDGDTGEPLWSQHSVERPNPMVVGDANGDEAPDVAVVDWYAWEHPRQLEADRTTLQELPIRVVSGQDGSTLWQGTTMTAPGDFAKQLATFEATGVIDVNQDGVADLVQDDPLQLDDQTMVHRLSVVSGDDGQVLWTTEAAGTFAHLARSPDVDGDGVHDVALVSGDVNDLWITMLSGKDGNPLWSRRLLDVPVSSFSEALPKLAVHPIENETGADNALVNLHLTLTTYSTVNYISAGGESGSYLITSDQLAPKMTLLEGSTGKIGWSLPTAENPDASLILGHTPATQTFQAFEEEQSQGLAAQAQQAAKDATPWAVSAITGAVFGALLAAALLALIQRRRTRQEVPDLE